MERGSGKTNRSYSVLGNFFRSVSSAFDLASSPFAGHSQEMKGLISIVRAFIFFLATGILGLTRAKQMQQYLIEQNKANGQPKFNPFHKYVKSKTYVTVTRLIGVACLIVSAFIGFLMLKALISRNR